MQILSGIKSTRLLWLFGLSSTALSYPWVNNCLIAYLLSKCSIILSVVSFLVTGTKKTWQSQAKKESFILGHTFHASVPGHLALRGKGRTAKSWSRHGGKEAKREAQGHGQEYILLGHTLSTHLFQPDPTCEQRHQLWRQLCTDLRRSVECLHGPHPKHLQGSNKLKNCFL